jgi:hypothetical protein
MLCKKEMYSIVDEKAAQAREAGSAKAIHAPAGRGDGTGAGMREGRRR